MVYEHDLKFTVILNKVGIQKFASISKTAELNHVAY